MSYELCSAFKGKDVLILGGGDGALLKEVLEEEPRFVTMIDVMTALVQQRVLNIDLRILTF